MREAEMPAASISSPGVPEPGRPPTAHCRTRSARPVPARASSTAAPRPPLGVVVLGDDQPAAGRRGRLSQGGLADRLDRVQVDDPGGDPVGGQFIGGAQALVHGDARPDQGDLIALAGSQHLGPADREGLAVWVEDGPGAPAALNIAYSSGDACPLEKIR